MDYMIMFLLLIIVVMMLFKRPLDINVKITHKIEQASPPPLSEEDKQAEEEQSRMLYEVAKSIQDIMLGGEDNDSNRA